MIGELRQHVRPEWIDYNGHLGEAYYVLVFGFATNALMECTGLDEPEEVALQPAQAQEVLEASTLDG